MPQYASRYEYSVEQPEASECATQKEDSRTTVLRTLDRVNYFTSERDKLLVSLNEALKIATEEKLAWQKRAEEIENAIRMVDGVNNAVDNKPSYQFRP